MFCVAESRPAACSSNIHVVYAGQTVLLLHCNRYTAPTRLPLLLHNQSTLVLLLGDCA
jgi:hypothetical protein